jgi:hypothetical protein
MELLAESKIVEPTRLQALLKEAEELTAIFVSSVKTVKHLR